ncbi:hypothetical protein PRUB_a0503 [Pseudoalteromonas rubra]|uniref:Uncharacterized protein n=1 Tax=Pseudoalteromonas rubra TaxID=43658 RepID=A0A8T0C5U5_9GAMM|nr:hypothetical protein PRUB_a0503 [Pseudoalteromonas rubra]
MGVCEHRGKNWLFKLQTSYGDECFIMNESTYKELNLKSPVDKPMLDGTDVGSSFIVSTTDVSGIKVVISAK